MVHVISVTDARTGIQFNGVIELKRDAKPTIKFYDTRYPHTEFGQFTGGGYYIETILDVQYGLNLDGGIPEWSICAESFQPFLSQVRSYMIRNHAAA